MEHRVMKWKKKKTTVNRMATNATKNECTSDDQTQKKTILKNQLEKKKDRWNGNEIVWQKNDK